ncbi:MAG TPA: Uma2 family endonuclease [Kamptonema sp.]|nr:Uma2 family endonuclease [Kamptonema sp.]
MTSSLAPTQVLETDTWVKATWEEFMKVAEDPVYENGKFYYYEGYMRIEMSPVGPRHGRQNSIIPYVFILFAAIKNIGIVQFTNTSFRKAGLDEFQPDLAYYIGSGLRIPPDNTNSPIDLTEYDPPTLVVEVGASSVADDLGWKRLLYEEAGVQEYWVNNANARDIIAFSVIAENSRRIQDSQVLPGLSLAVVKEALKRSETQDDGAINRWLISIFSQD